METQLQRQIQKALRSRGAFVFKVHGSEYMMSGLPDLIVCYRGYYAGIEAKDPSNKRRDVRQSYVHRKIRESGGIVRVAQSVPEALAVLDEIDAWADKFE